jgi:hypothetical protein
MHPIITNPPSVISLVDAMHINPQTVLHFKKIAPPLLTVAAAAVGIWAVGLFGDYFEAFPIYAPVMVTHSVGIDILGALAPIIVALVALAVFFKTAKAPVKKFAIAFATSTALAFLFSHVTPDGLASLPLLFALGSSVAATAINVYPKPFSRLQKKLTATVMLTLACAPLSMFVADLAYSPYFTSAVIGGNGLTDGLLLSTLYAPLTVTMIFSALAYSAHMVLLVKTSGDNKKINALPKNNPVTTKKAPLNP